MTKIEIRSGDDWLEVFVDGVNVHRGHSMSPYHWSEVLKRLPNVEVDMPEGNFCEDCGGWYVNPPCGCFDEEE
jgi:hypothetical protein